MHNLFKLKEVYKKVIEQATPLVELSLADGKQFDKEKFMFLIEATKGLKEIEELEIMKEGKELVYDYLDIDDEEGMRDGRREYVSGYTRNGRRERVRGYYRNGRRGRDSMGRYTSSRNGKTDYVDRRYRMDESGMYLEDEMPARERSFEDSGYGQEQYEESMRSGRTYNNGRSSGSNSGYGSGSGYNSGNSGRNYRFKKKYGDDFDTEIEAEIYKVIESKPDEHEQTEVVEKIISVLAESVNDLKTMYPKLYDKVINKIKVMK